MADDEAPAEDLRAMTDAADDAGGSQTDESGEGDTSIADRIRGVRQRFQKRRSRKQAEAKAEDLKAERERRARQRRIEANNPETAGESLAAASNEVNLLSAELGITADAARDVLEQGGEVVDQALEQGDGALAQLDVDGDGDTDILESLEAGDIEATRDGRAGTDSVDPASSIEAEMGTLDGIEDELGLDEPIEQQQDGGLR